MLGFAKRNSKFDPRSIPGCALWLDGADQSTSGMLLSGSSVTTWKDKSGNGRDLSASGSYPTITSNGVLFNGATPNVLSNATAFAAVNGINSFVVFNSTTASTRQRVFVYAYTGQKIGVATDTTYNSVFSSTVGGDGPVSYLANNTYIYGGNTYSSSPFISHSENGVETQYPSTYSLTASSQTLLIVGGQSTVYFTGTIKEIILFDAFLTTTQRQSIEGYLAWKWGIQVQVPAPVLTPLSISNCVLWLDAADPAGTGVLPSSGSVLSTWKDKSSNGYTGTSSGSPTFVTNSQNGLPVVNFVASSSQYFNFGNIIPQTPQSIFFVGKSTYVNGTGQSFIAKSLLGGQIGRWTLLWDGNYLNYLLETSGPVSDTTGTITPYSGLCSLFEGVWDGTTKTLYGNGTQLGTNSVSSAGTSTTDLVLVGAYNNSSGGVPPAAGLYYNGTMCEILVFSNALSTTQRQSVENYLMGKWGIKSSLPAIHPFYSIPAFSRPFRPVDIAGCTMWLDAADISTLMFSSGSNISNWMDKSGNGNNATQSTSANQPTYSGGGTVYAGSNWFQTPITSFPTAESIFIVFKSSTAVADIFAGPATDSREVLLYTGTKLFLGKVGIDPSATTPNAGVIPLNTILLYDVQYTSTAITFNVNGNTTGSGTPYFTFSGTGTSWIGSTGYAPNNMYGTIYEFIYYNSSLSTAQRQQVEGYLAAKWGLRSSVVSGHPFKSIPPCVSLPPQFSEVTPGRWTYDWQPYLNKLAAANSGATASFSSNVVSGTTAGALFYYVGGVLAPNGKIYCVPYQSTDIGIIDTTINAFSTTTFPTGTITGTGTGAAYCGGVFAPNGKIYFIPHQSTAVGVIDPTVNTFSTSVVSGTAPGGTGAYIGGVMAPNGKIYCVPANNTSIGIIDPVANTFSTTTFPTGTITGTGAGSTAYSGGVLAPNGKIYFIPRNATSVGVVDPITNTFTTFGTTPGSGAYITGVLAPNGKIYCMPGNATSIGIIDPVANTFSTTTFPTGTITGTGAGNGAYHGGVLGPNGKIYCIPLNATTVGVIDPVAGTFTTLGTATLFIGGILAPNGNIYCIPASSTKVGCISFSSLAQTPSSNYCLSAWTNKL